ncbi:hypothetical protein BKA81DRAFT_401049, partial [Phyllosticta paracitricarpa]
RRGRGSPRLPRKQRASGGPSRTGHGAGSREAEHHRPPDSPVDRRLHDQEPVLRQGWPDCFVGERLGRVVRRGCAARQVSPLEGLLSSSLEDVRRLAQAYVVTVFSTRYHTSSGR